MANLKNWLPPMTRDEHAWFDACPKAVLFAIAQQLAIMAVGEEDRALAFDRMREEWGALHACGNVPQRPFSVERDRARREAVAERIAAIRARGGDRLGDVAGIRGKTDR